MPKVASVSGVTENARALERAGDVDVEKAGTEAARNLLPYIEDETRSETGRMRAGWEAENSAFINTVEYSPFQEFGTFAVSPTNAIRKSVDRHEREITEAYEKEVDRAADKAGFGR